VQLFTRRSARLLFSNLRLQRWCFDVELVYLAHCFKIPVVEENVNWDEIPGTKIQWWAPLSMARDLLLVKVAYCSGAWVARSEEASATS
jgi:dolichyl-phosphate beta-glucosyltransferase